MADRRAAGDGEERLGVEDDAVLLERRADLVDPAGVGGVGAERGLGRVAGGDVVDLERPARDVAGVVVDRRVDELDPRLPPGRARQAVRPCVRHVAEEVGRGRAQHVLRLAAQQDAEGAVDGDQAARGVREGHAEGRVLERPVEEVPAAAQRHDQMAAHERQGRQRGDRHQPAARVRPAVGEERLAAEPGAARERDVHQRPAPVHEDEGVAATAPPARSLRRSCGRGRGERGRRRAQLVLRVARHRHQPEPRRAGGHGGRADGLGEDAAPPGPPRTAPWPPPPRRRPAARSACARAPRRSRGRRAPPAGRGRWPAAGRRGPGSSRSSRRPASAAPRHGRRQRGGVDQRAGAVDEVLRHRRVAAGEGAVGAERLAERADHHVHLALEPELGHEAAAARPDDAGRVRLVDHDAGAVAAARARRSRPAARGRRPWRTPRR